MYNGQLPLFPTFYRIEVAFDDPGDEPIVWDSGVPYQEKEVQELTHPLPSAPAKARVFYQLHAFNIRQRLEQGRQQRLQQLSILAVIATLVILGQQWLDSAGSGVSDAAATPTLIGGST